MFGGGSAGRPGDGGWRTGGEAPKEEDERRRKDKRRMM
jgi:hypothetical protein